MSSGHINQALASSLFLCHALDPLVKVLALHEEPPANQEAAGPATCRAQLIERADREIEVERDIVPREDGEFDKIRHPLCPLVAVLFVARLPCRCRHFNASTKKTRLAA